MIQFNCPNCQKVLQTPQQYAGKQAKCPQCGQVATVPAQVFAPVQVVSPAAPPPSPSPSAFRESRERGHDERRPSDRRDGYEDDRRPRRREDDDYDRGPRRRIGYDDWRDRPPSDRHTLTPFPTWLVVLLNFL